MLTKNKYIVQVRNYHPTFTESALFVPWQNERFCFVLEDIARPAGVKFAGDTCIPEMICAVSISVSTRFKKSMLLLSNADKIGTGIVSKAGVSFSGIRPHGGNDTEDTAGCPLCAFNSDHKGRVWGRASDEIFKRVQADIEQGYNYFWVITS